MAVEKMRKRKTKSKNEIGRKMKRGNRIYKRA